MSECDLHGGWIRDIIGGAVHFVVFQYAAGKENYRLCFETSLSRSLLTVKLRPRALASPYQNEIISLKSSGPRLLETSNPCANKEALYWTCCEPRVYVNPLSIPKIQK